MASKLVIVESPAKAKTIGKFLGRGYKVEASQGHVRDMPKSQIGVDIENNFEPKYITIRGRGEILNRSRQTRTAKEKRFHGILQMFSALTRAARAALNSTKLPRRRFRLR